MIAVDLPGHGLKALFPEAYLTQDAERLPKEPSPQKHIRLADYTGAIVDIIEQIDEEVEIVLVGHSMSGVVVTKAGDLAAERIARIVYVSAYVPVLLPSSPSYIGLPENKGSRGDVFIGDPQATGAIRMNPRSGEHAYIEEIRATFYNDVGFEQFIPYLNTLTPDLPLGPLSDDARGSPERWGKVPRTYVRCTQDKAIPIALQDRMIREADETYPQNKFSVHTLESGHSPFASMPDQLAELIRRS